MALLRQSNWMPFLSILYKNNIKKCLLDFTRTPNCLHYVIACGMQIKTVSHQESTTRLIHKARHGTIHDKIMPVIHFLPLLTQKFFSDQHTNVSASKKHTGATGDQLLPLGNWTSNFFHITFSVGYPGFDGWDSDAIMI